MRHKYGCIESYELYMHDDNFVILQCPACEYFAVYRRVSKVREE